MEMAATRPVPANLGEYFLVDDIDPADRHYGLVDLNDPALIATDGWAPSEGNPHFHQQMVYAVALTTVSYFEKALGRRVLWRATDADERRGSGPGCTLRPHALRQANAFYSPRRGRAAVRLLRRRSRRPPATTGPARRSSPACPTTSSPTRPPTPSWTACTAASTSRPTPTCSPFHEAFADIVALLQHFTLPELLAHQIEQDARQPGGRHHAGQPGRPVRPRHRPRRRPPRRHRPARPGRDLGAARQPDPSQYRTATAPHARGAILVAAVFDAFLTIYRARSADLFRLATGGTGILPAGALHPDLVRRLADEATKAAGHVLNMAHPGPRLPAPRRRHLLRLPTGADHRRPRSGPRRPVQLPGRVRRSLPPPRHPPRATRLGSPQPPCHLVRGHAALARA